MFTAAPKPPKPVVPHARDIGLPGWNPAKSGACRGPDNSKVNGKYSNTAGANGKMSQAECAAACSAELNCIGYAHSTAWCVVYGPAIDVTPGDDWTGDSHPATTIVMLKPNPSYLCVTPKRGQNALSFTHIAGYEPYSDVSQHSYIDIDQRSVEAALKTFDWTAATKVYTEGEHSLKSSGKRNLKAFSVNSCKLKNEKYFKIHNDYWTSNGLKNCEYGNDIVSAALAGGKLGQTGFTFANKDDQFRKEAVKKSIVYQNVFMYTIWEMQDAINDCRDAGDLKNNENSVHAWDEAVAFYTGSLEGVVQGGENGLSSGTKFGKLLFNLAEKRCANFGTCTADFDGSEKSGYSQVNSNIFEKFNKAKQTLYYAESTQNFKCPGLYKAKD